MEQDQQRSPESCVYAVGVVGEGNRTHQYGTLEVTPSQLIYTPDGEQDSYIWPLRYLRRYASESETMFTIEAGSRCPSGPGLYTFSTERARELHSIVSRNVTAVVTSPSHSATNTDTQTTPTPSPSFAPPSSPSISGSSYFSRGNGVPSPHSPHPPHHRHSSHSSLSPTSSPTLSRSSSIRSLPENVFEVKNIGDNESLSQDGLLEVTPQELVYTENSSQQRWVWPLMYLRRYGCHDNVFSIEAGRRCPGGPGFYSFSTQRISELYDLVQTYAKNFYSSQLSLCSVDYSMTAPPPSVSLTSQRHTPSPVAEGRSESSPVFEGRSESPVFHRSDSFIRRAFSAMELRKNVFEVHNLGDNEQVLGKGILEVTNSELVYIDAATGDRWSWPIKYLRRYGCNGVRVFSFEAGRRCPGGEGLYAFATSRANEIHEAIIESINTTSANQMQMGGRLSVSRLSLADTSSPRGGWMHKASAPVVTNQFLTPPPMRKPSQPTLDEVPSAHPRTSTPTRQSYSSDETDAIDGGSTNTSDPSAEQKHKTSKPTVQHTYDVPQEAKDAYTRQQNSAGSEKNNKVKPPLKKKPLLPPSHKGKLRFQRFASDGQKPADSSPTNSTQRRLNGHTNHVADSHSTSSIPELSSLRQAQEREESFYQNIQVQSLPRSEGNGPNIASEANSLYANLSPIQKSVTPPPNMSTERTVYANISELMAGSESGRSNSTPSSPSTLTSSSYAEVEIIDMPPTSDSVASPDSCAWSPSSPGIRERALPRNSNGCNILSHKSAEENVVYDALNFSVMKSLATLKETRGDTQNFADLLERHSYRDRESGSRKKK